MAELYWIHAAKKYGEMYLLQTEILLLYYVFNLLISHVVDLKLHWYHCKMIPKTMKFDDWVIYVKRVWRYK